MKPGTMKHATSWVLFIALVGLPIAAPVLAETAVHKPAKPTYRPKASPSPSSQGLRSAQRHAHGSQGSNSGRLGVSGRHGNLHGSVGVHAYGFPYGSSFDSRHYGSYNHGSYNPGSYDPYVQPYVPHFPHQPTGQTYVFYESYPPPAPRYAEPQYVAPAPAPQPIYIVVERPATGSPTVAPDPAPTPQTVPAAPRSSAPEKVWLAIEPADAKVYLDGRYLGTAETMGRLEEAIELRPGVYVIEVKHDDLPDERLVFGVNPDVPSTVEIDLRATKPARRARLTTANDLPLFPSDD